MAGHTPIYTTEHHEENFEIELRPEDEVVRRCRRHLIKGLDPNILYVYLNLTPIDEEAIKAKSNNGGNTLAAVELFDRLVRTEDYWTDLLEALCDENVGRSDLAQLLQKDMEKWKLEKQEKEAALCQAKRDNKKHVLTKPKVASENVLQKQPQIETQWETKTDKSTQNPVPENKIISPSRMKQPRKYQLELAKKGQEGYNTIICSPTGSGKTFVAYLICKSHFEKMFPTTKQIQGQEVVIEPASIDSVKIFIVVHTVPILMQWYSILKDLFPLWRLDKKSGASNVNLRLKDMMKINDIIILTAGTLQNALSDKTDPVKITDATLIVFDECHHTMQDHPYNMVMAEYLRVKVRTPNNQQRLPQIIGLTAIPGAGKKVDVRNRILELCANLDCDMFITVPVHCEDELSKHVPMPVKKVKITENRINNPFNNCLNKIMKSIEGKIDLKISFERHLPQYISKIDDMKDLALERQNQGLQKCADTLLEYHKGLTLADAARLRDGYNILNKYHAKLTDRIDKGGKLDDTEKMLLDLFTDHKTALENYAEKEVDYPNPKLEHLVKGIAEQKDLCTQEKDDLRVMVFVKSINIAMALKQWILDEPRLKYLIPYIFTGDMTQSEQKEVTDGFDCRDDKDRILLSTSIGEEGIDIASCNMVVNYNRQTNDISMMQSKGRARHKRGVELMIGDLTSAEKNNINLLLIKKMEYAIDEIKQLQVDDNSEYIRVIRLTQEQIISKREKQLQSKQQKRSANPSNNIQLKCKGACNKIACRASDIVLMGKCSFVNPHQEFKAMVEFREHTDEKKRQRGIKKIYCNECKYDWGNTAGGYPSLKLSNFLIFVDGRPTKIKQWKDIPCKIESFEEYMQNDKFEDARESFPNED